MTTTSILAAAIPASSTTATPQNAPVNEAPAANTPAADTPATETLAADTPATETLTAESTVGSDTDKATRAFGNTYKIKVAVMDLRGSASIPEELRLALGDTVPETIDELGPFKAISSQDVVKMLQYEAHAQSLGCDDPSCLSQLGDALGADFLVTGNLTQANETVVIQLQLMNTRGGGVENRVSRERVGTGSGLFDAVRLAAKLLMRPILGQHSGELELSVSEEGATVTVDDSIVGVSPIVGPLSLAGGTHTVGIEKQGFIHFAQDVLVTEDHRSSIVARLEPSAEFIRAYEARASRLRMGAYVAAGAGVLVSGLGIAMVAIASDQATALNRETQAYNLQASRTSARHEELGRWARDIGTLESLIIPTFLVGVGAAATGALMWILGPDPDRYEAQTYVEPGVSAELQIIPGGVALRGRF